MRPSGAGLGSRYTSLATHLRWVPRAEGHNTAGGVEPFQSEGRSSTVTEQPFDARSVLTLDVDGRVDAEPTGALPGKHPVGVNFVEQAVAM